MNRSIVFYPNPILRKTCAPAKFDTEHKLIAQDLLDTFRGKRALGLAAPQIGHPVRIIVVNGLLVVNPQIISRSAEQVDSREGCLSIPYLDTTHYPI